MGSEISLPFSYEPISGPCSKPDKSSTELCTIILTKSISVIASHLSLFLPTAFFSFDVPAKQYAFPLYPFCPKFNPFYYIDQGTQIIIYYQIINFFSSFKFLFHVSYLWGLG